MSFALVSLVSMLIVLGIMVLVHEFGHFIVAKWCGVRVEVFSIGFGKRLFGIRRGDTDYRVSLLPLGGYVKMTGEIIGDVPTGEASNDAGNYGNHPRWQRVLIACAGPAANFVLAFLLLVTVFMAHNEVPNFMNGAAIVDYAQPGSAAAIAGLQRNDTLVRYDGVQNPDWQQVYLHSILNLNHTVQLQVLRAGQIVSLQMRMPNSTNPDDFALQDLGISAREQSNPIQVASADTSDPGYHAGLRVGDQIAAVDGFHFHSIYSINLYLQHQAGAPLVLTVLRHGQTLLLPLTPSLQTGATGKPQYLIGFSADPPPFHVERLSLTEAAAKSLHENIKDSTLIVEVLRRMATLRMSVRSLSGPVGIAQETGRIVAMPGWTPLFSEMATISLNLGIFNLLPIPILDGGVILFLLVESLLRRDLNQQFKERVYQTAFVFLILVFALVLVNDLSKFSIFARLHP